MNSQYETTSFSETSSADNQQENSTSQMAGNETKKLSSSSSHKKKSSSAFRTISEVADMLSVQQHVLRFWETKFTQVKPLKRGGGRRYYRPEDVAVLQRIHHLLYTEGYTIKGVQKLLKGQGKQQIMQEQQEDDIAVANKSSKPVNEEAANALKANASRLNSAQRAPSALKTEQGLTDKQRSILTAMLGDLKELRDMIKGEES